MRIIPALTVAVLCLPSLVVAAPQDVPPAYKSVLTVLGRSGDFKDGVLNHGAPADLAKRVKPALDLVMRGVTPAPPAPPAPPAIDGAALARIIGVPGEQSGAVYKITIGRTDLAVKEMGAVINARMGLNTWAAFTGTNDDAVVAGDVAMLGKEVTPVLTAMRKAGLSVVSLHHHMIGTQPEIYFLHYWGQGPAVTLAAGVKSAVALVGK